MIQLTTFNKEAGNVIGHVWLFVCLLVCKVTQQAVSGFAGVLSCRETNDTRGEEGGGANSNFCD